VQSIVDKQSRKIFESRMEMFDVSSDIMLKVVEQPEVRHVERLIADRIRPNRRIMKDSSSIQTRPEMHQRRAILALAILGLVGGPWSWRWLLNHERAGKGSPTAFSAAWAGFVAFDVPRLALSTAPPCFLVELAHLRRRCFAFRHGFSLSLFVVCDDDLGSGETGWNPLTEIIGRES
jgi:hypothetical protein